MCPGRPMCEVGSVPSRTVCSVGGSRKYISRKHPSGTLYGVGSICHRADGGLESVLVGRFVE